MASIDQILNDLGVSEEETKIASASSETPTDFVEQQAVELGLFDNTEKTASLNNNKGETSMNLQDIYDGHFNEEETKLAHDSSVHYADEGMSKEAQSALGEAGELARLRFDQGLEERVLGMSIKLAMDAAPDSEATKAIQGGAAVMAGSPVVNPQLAVNKGMDDDESMDTTPQHYDLLSKAVAKKVLEAKLEQGEPEELSHQVMQVDTGLEMPNSQKNA